jgi:multiple sugar transport system permease protein
MMRPSMKTNRIIGSTLNGVILFIALFLLLVPIYYMVSSSFKTQRQMMDFKQFIKFTPTLSNYKKLFEQYDIMKPMSVSIIVTVMATGLACLFGIPAAYAISRHKMHKLSAVILSVRIVPAVTFLIPWYIILSKMHLLGTLTALIAANLLVSLPLIIWIVVPYFGSISKELEEAAFIDGCSEAGSLVRIMIPLSSPGIITATILSFIKVWNNYMFAFVLGGTKSRTLPVMLKVFIGYTGIDYACLVTAATIVALPVVVLSIFMNKHVVTGLTAGAVKA